jgi:hypothetical protein
MMPRFLGQIGEDFADFFIGMQADQAGWHGSRELVIPATLGLIQQPASSPQVNLVEHWWEELREKDLHTRLFSCLDQQVEELGRGLNELTEDKARLTSMMSFPPLNGAL